MAKDPLDALVATKDPLDALGGQPEDSWDYLIRRGGSLRDTLPLPAQPAYDNLLSTVKNPKEFEDTLAQTLYLRGVLGLDVEPAYEMRDVLTRHLFKQPLSPSQVVARAVQNDDLIQRFVDVWNAQQPPEPMTGGQYLLRAITETPSRFWVGTLGLTSGALSAAKRNAMMFSGAFMRPQAGGTPFEAVKAQEPPQMDPLMFQLYGGPVRLPGAVAGEAIGTVGRLPDVGRMALDAEAARLRKKTPLPTFKEAPISRLWGGFVESGAPSLTLGIVVGLLTGDPVIALASMGETSGGQEFEQELEKGYSPRAAMLLSGINEAAEIAGEQLVLPSFIEGITKGIPLNKAFGLIVENFGQEAATQFVQGFAPAFADARGRGMSMGEASRFAFGEGTKGMLEAGAYGAIGGGAVSVASLPASIYQSGKSRQQAGRIAGLLESIPPEQRKRALRVLAAQGGLSEKIVADLEAEQEAQRAAEEAAATTVPPEGRATVAGQKAPAAEGAPAPTTAEEGAVAETPATIEPVPQEVWQSANWPHPQEGETRAQYVERVADPELEAEPEGYWEANLPTGRPGMQIETISGAAGKAQIMGVVYRNEQGDPVGNLLWEVNPEGQVKLGTEEEEGLLQVWVHPLYRRQGIGRAMMDFAYRSGIPLDKIETRYMTKAGAGLLYDLETGTPRPPAISAGQEQAANVRDIRQLEQRADELVRKAEFLTAAEQTELEQIDSEIERLMFGPVERFSIGTQEGDRSKIPPQLAPWADQVDRVATMPSSELLEASPSFRWFKHRVATIIKNSFPRYRRQIDTWVEALRNDAYLEAIRELAYWPSVKRDFLNWAQDHTQGEETPAMVFVYGRKAVGRLVIYRWFREEKVRGLSIPASFQQTEGKRRGKVTEVVSDIEKWKNLEAGVVSLPEYEPGGELADIEAEGTSIVPYQEEPYVREKGGQFRPSSEYAAGMRVAGTLRGVNRSARMYPVMETAVTETLTDDRLSSLSRRERATLDDLIEEANQQRIEAFPYAMRRMPSIDSTVKKLWDLVRLQMHRNAGEQSRLESWPTWEEEKARIAILGEQPGRVTIVGYPRPESQSLVDQLAQSATLAGKVVVEFLPPFDKRTKNQLEQGLPEPTEAQSRDSMGDTEYEKARTEGKGLVAHGRTRNSRDGGGYQITISHEAPDQPRVIAEELGHVGYDLIRAGSPQLSEAIRVWHADRVAKGLTDLNEGEDFAQMVSYALTVPSLKYRGPRLPAAALQYVRDMIAGTLDVGPEVWNYAVGTERFSIGEETGELEGGELIVPADIYEGRKPSRPDQRGFGLTAAERAMFPRASGRLVRWAQIHQQEVGYKKGVADTVENSRRALDALRMRMEEKIASEKAKGEKRITRMRENVSSRNRNRIDAMNLVVTYVPKEYQANYINRMMQAETPKAVNDLLSSVEKWIDDKEQRELIKEFKRFKGQVRKQTRRGEVPFGELPVDLANKIDELLNQFDPVKMTEHKAESLASRQEWYSRMVSLLADGYEKISGEYDQEAHDFFVIPKSKIEELRRLAQTPVAEATPEELRWIIDQVNHLLTMHELKGNSKIRRRWEALSTKLNAARQEVQGHKPGPKIAGLTGLLGKSATIGQSNLRSLVNYATGKNSEATVGLLFDALVEGDHRRVAKYREFVEAWRRELDAADIKWGDVSKTLDELVKVKIGGEEIELTRDDLLMLYGYTVADGTMRRLLTTEGLNITTYRKKAIFWETKQEYRVGQPTLDELRAISALIPDVHKRLLEIHFKVNWEHQRPAINEVSMELENTEQARDKRYLHVSRETRKAFSGFNMEEMSAAAEAEGRRKPRTGGIQRMNIRGFSREIMTGLQSDAFYNGMTIPMMDARALLMSKRFVSAMKDNGHRDILDYIGKIIDRMQIYSTDQALLDQAYTTAFRQAGKGILIGRITSPAIQSASLPAAWAVIDRKYFEVRPPSRDTIRKLTDKYPSLWLRWHARQFDYAIGAATARNAFEQMLFGHQGATDRLMNPYTWGDQIAVVNIHQAAERMVQDTTDFEPGSPEYENAVGRLFDRAMETQPMWDTLHRSVMASDTGPIARGFTWFMSARNAQMNVIFQAVDDARKGRITPKEMWSKIGDIALANFSVSFLRNLIRTGIYAVGASFMVAFGLREPPDKDEALALAKRLGKALPTETVLNLLGLNVWGGVMTTIAQQGIRFHKFKWDAYNVRNFRTGNMSVDILNDIASTATEFGEFGADLLTGKKTKPTKYKAGEYAFLDSGARLLWDTMKLVSYSLGLPFEGPIQDFYYPLKRAYEQEYTRKKNE